MAPNVVFHVGAPKTGSTYVQKRLRQNPDVLARHNLHYPVVPGFEKIAANAKRLTIAFDVGLAGSFSRSFSDVDVSDLDPRRELDALVGNTPSEIKTVVLSSEKMRYWQAKPLADLIGQDFPCRIVLYVRKQDDWMDSYFNQLVKNRNSTSIDDIVDKVISGNDRGFFCPDWLKNFQAWSDNFADCDVIPYDAPTGNIFDKFVQVLGFQNSNDFQDIEKTNESMSAFEIAYLARVDADASLAQFFQHRKACKKVAPVNTTKSSFLNRQHRQALRDRFEDSNTELMNILGYDADLLAIKPEATHFVSIAEMSASDEFKEFEQAVETALAQSKR
jgi:hypothetical protein